MTKAIFVQFINSPYGLCAGHAVTHRCIQNALWMPDRVHFVDFRLYRERGSTKVSETPHEPTSSTRSMSHIVEQMDFFISAQKKSPVNNDIKL